MCRARVAAQLRGHGQPALPLVAPTVSATNGPAPQRPPLAAGRPRALTLATRQLMHATVAFLCLSPAPSPVLAAVPGRRPVVSRRLLGSPFPLPRARTLGGLPQQHPSPARTPPPVRAASWSSSGPHDPGPRGGLHLPTEDPRGAPGTWQAPDDPELQSSATPLLPPSAGHLRTPIPAGQPGWHLICFLRLTWKLPPHAAPAHKPVGRLAAMASRAWLCQSPDRVALLGP